MENKIQEIISELEWEINFKKQYPPEYCQNPEIAMAEYTSYIRGLEYALELVKQANGK